MLKLIVFAFFCAPWLAQGQVSEDVVNKNARGRYTTDSEFKFEKGVEFSQPDYKFETNLPEGFGRATAQELGVVGQHFWNEYPGQGAALVKMAPDTVLLYDTVSKEPLYVTGCHRDGRADGLNRLKGMNRIKREVPPPAPPPEAAPPPPAPVCPCPPPTQVVDVGIPPAAPPVELITLPPPLGSPPDSTFVATLVWDKEKGWWWTWTPLWCIDVRKFSDIYKPVTCASLAVGGYWLAGGFKAAAIIKAAVPVTR